MNPYRLGNDTVLKGVRIIAAKLVLEVPIMTKSK